MSEYYIEHPRKAVETDGRFAHVMAITLDPRENYKKGLVRCVISRSGDLAIKGNIDRSELHLITGDSLDNFKIGERLKIKDEEEILTKLIPDGGDFIGLEDPDIWIDTAADLVHVYFTIPIIVDHKNKSSQIHLGHAVGKNLDSLVMTQPVLVGGDGRAKEVSIAPLNSQGFRYNLFESKDRKNNVSYAIVKVAIARDMGKPWEYGEVAFHPSEHNIPWIAGHASPGPLFSKEFIDVGEGKLLGIINGREANQQIGDEI